jgi:hypothetical protein
MIKFFKMFLATVATTFLVGSLSDQLLSKAEAAKRRFCVNAGCEEGGTACRPPTDQCECRSIPGQPGTGQYCHTKW